MNTTPKPLVSVMIPYYNCKHYIDETLASVADQTHPNLEIIVIDDGSAPEHAEYLQAFLSNKPHIRYRRQNNQGVAAARNHAARLASGKYFLFLDADDVILPGYIEKAVEILENQPNCKLVYPQAEFFEAQSGLWEIPAYEGLQSLLLGNRFPSSISIHRAADYHSLGGFDESLKTHEDWDYWIRLLQNGGEVYRIPEVLFRYRKRSDHSSLMNTLEQNPQHIAADWQKIYNKHQNLFIEQGLHYWHLAAEKTANLYLQNQMAQLSITQEQTEQQVRNLSAANAQSEAARQKLADNNQHLTEENHLLRENIMSFEQQNQELKNLLAKILEQNEHAAKQSALLQTQIDILTQALKKSSAAENQLRQYQQTVAELETKIQQLNHDLSQQQGTVHDKQTHIVNIEHMLANQQAYSEKLSRYSSLYSYKAIKPLLSVERGISSANHYRNAFRHLIREKGSIGKAYQFLRHMYLDHDMKTVKHFLKGRISFPAAVHGTAIPASSDTFDITNNSAYQEWIRLNDTPSETHITAMRAQAEAFEYRPKISVLMPVYNVDTKWLSMAIDSVRNQYYDNWELCIADDASPNADIRPLLERYAAEDSRIKVVFREKNGHISENSNSALALCTGEWTALMDHDDLLPPHALFEIVKVLQTQPDAALIYTDEDKIDENGRRFMPHFKSDFNLDLLYGQNYISHLGVYRTDIAQKIGGFRKGLEGSQDYDFLLRYLLETDQSKVVHIPKILYHWRAIEGSTALAAGEKSYTTEAGIKALQNHFALLGKEVTVTRGKADNLYRVQWHWQEQPLVSLIIPTYNGYAITKQAIDSILNKTAYSNYEILLVDNNSDDPQALAYFDDIAQHEKVTLLRYPHPFNYSAINNFAAKHAKGSIIGLINNDIEVINPQWLTEMVSQAQRPEIGCVGAMLYYPNDTIQHAGVFIGINGVAAHSHKHYPRKHPGFFSRLYVAQNLMAVTAACLLVRKDVFNEVNGLNEEHLTVAFNDVDFCLKVHAAGYRNLWTPYAELYHHESISRGHEDNPEKQARFQREIKYMIDTWHTDTLLDPYYNPNLTIRHENFSIALKSRVEP